MVYPGGVPVNIRGRSGSGITPSMLNSFGPVNIHYFEIKKDGTIELYEGNDPDLSLHKYWEVQVWPTTTLVYHNRVTAKRIHKILQRSKNIPRVLKTQLLLMGVPLK